MCGLITSLDTRVSYEDIKKAIDKMSYRGDVPSVVTPCEEGFAAHVSLPLCSLDPYAYSQPVNGFSFVGEIFNYKEIDPSAVNDVHMIRDLIIEKENESQFSWIKDLHRLDGFWAISYINKENQLIAISDYLSQKPIYYRTDRNVVASEIDCLLDLAKVTEDKVYMSNIMKWGYDPTGRTPYNEIKQMPPGSIYKDGIIETYWDWSLIQAQDLVLDNLTKAVANRIDASRPISLLLSGGLDSSIIYEIAKRFIPDIKVFHVENDESQYADLITKNRTNVKLDNVTDEEAVAIHKTPVDLGSVKPQIALAKAIKKEKGYQIVLTGDGADELFGGYRRSQDYDSQMSDVFLELPYYHLPKLDRVMMHSTTEVRSPFLAPYMVKFAMSLPYSERINKKHLKEAVSRFIPEEIINRKKVPLKTKEIALGLLTNTKNNINTFRRLKND